MNIIKTILILIIFTSISACTSLPRIYSGEEVHGWVIDSKTKEPVKDVVVVIAWELEGGLHTDHTGNVHIAEAVTDEKGYYSFKSWGPRMTVDGRRSESTPYLVFYKFGYEWTSRRNRVSGNLNPDNSVSEYSGKMIELVKFEGSIEQYPKKIDSAAGILRLGHYRGPFACMWKEVPIFTSEMIKADRHFRKKKIYAAIPYLNSLSAHGCRNPDVILEVYLK